MAITKGNIPLQFMRSIPHDLDEAAAIDGCGPVKILYKIICPMLSPSLVACALFQFMWSCNDFMGPLLYVTTPTAPPPPTAPTPPAPKAI